jgi:RNA polymerase sigma factor (sigma-70 family)
MITTGKTTVAPVVEWSDERLVQECLKGNQDAWNAMLKKYGKLIHSVPSRYGLSREDAGDIFQQVCMQLLEALPDLREPKSLGAWLIKVTAHRCFQWVARERRFQSFDFEGQANEGSVGLEMPEAMLHELERRRILHDAVSEVPPRCRELIRLLFFETTAVSYQEVAKKLGLAEGSIGFIRMRCLKHLRKGLEGRRFL